MAKTAQGDRRFFSPSKEALRKSLEREHERALYLDTNLQLVTAERDARPALPIPMLLWCPACGKRHIDKGEFATKHHHTHACQSCGMVWRPAVVATVGVLFLPGFKDDAMHGLEAGRLSLEVKGFEVTEAQAKAIGGK